MVDLRSVFTIEQAKLNHKERSDGGLGVLLEMEMEMEEEKPYMSILNLTHKI